MLGEKIKELREKENYSQKELRLKLGISPSTIGMYEQNRRLPFNGEPATEEAIQSILDAMEMGMALAKEKNKKYTPNKYKK